MSKELLLVVDAVANEKGVPREVIFDAIEAALASAAKKRYPDEEVLTRVVIDHKDGSYETFRRWEVVADDVVMESPDRQIRLMDAVDEAEGVDVGDYIEEQIENPDFGRIAAQAAKQVIVQRVREAERQQVVDAWKDRVGELITGVVKRAERGNIYVDLGGNAEGFIPKDKGIPRDVLRAGDRVRGYLAEVRSEPRGPQLFISRAAPESSWKCRKSARAWWKSRPAPVIRATAPRSPCSPTTSAPIRSVPASACAVRACRPCPTSSMASAWTSCCGTTTRPTSSSTRWRRPKCSRSSSMKTSTRWTWPLPKTAWPRRSARAARTCAWPAA